MRPETTATRDHIHAAPADSSRAETERLTLVAALDTSEDAITTCSLDGVFVTWNRGAERLYGYSASEAIGQPLDLIVPAGEHEHEHGNWERLLNDEPVRSLETVRITKDGRRVLVAVTRSLIFDAAGAVIGVASVGRDITAHKHAQAMLAAAHAEAVAASKMKSQFMANMSHELRTPLNGVIGISRLLLDTDLTPEQREYGEALKISGEALLDVIGDILDLSKIEAGKLELSQEPFELRAVVEDVCSIVALGAAMADVRLASALECDLPSRVCGDEHRLRQVLTNLVSNAVKFTPDGEVTITVGRAPGESAVRFEVADTGIGIAREAQDAIFESFAQADGSTTRRYGGTGLGLTIARQLVTLMGGTIDVRSTLGEGSTFSFTLPLAAAPDALDPSLAALRGMTVLVVDANASGRRLLAAELAGAGATVHNAPPGEEALAMLRRDDTPDVVLADAAGDAVATIRDAAPATPIVLIAAPHEMRRASSIAGVAGLLARPVRRARLLEELAGAAGATGEAPRASAATPSPAFAGGGQARAHRVLVAEDNPVNQLVVRRLLEQRGYLVDIAANGREALDMHARSPYDLIIMDCHMPELDGYGATRELRRIEGGARHTPVVALTASTMPGDTQRCFDAGMDHFAGKPIRPALLDEVLARALGA